MNLYQLKPNNMTSIHDRMKLMPSAFILIILTGCVSYASVGPGPQDYNGLKIKTSQTWNQAPMEVTPAARPESKLWTQDGVLLDRIMIIPGVPSGESLFKALSSDQALPVFQADMLPNEIEGLNESSIVKLSVKVTRWWKLPTYDLISMVTKTESCLT